MQSFLAADYVVFAATVLLSVSIGIYFACAGSGQNSTVDYFHGGRKLHYAPVALSLVVTFQSSIMLLGFPAEVYFYGYMICLFNIGQCAAIFISTRIIVPLMYRLQITSVFNYLELRFRSNIVRHLTVSIGIIAQCCYMGVVLFGPAIAFQSVTNFPVWASIVCISLASVIYTSIGGIKAVIWTDVIQCVIIIVGIIAILIKGTIDAGGVAFIFEQNLKSGRLDILDFNPDPTIRHTFWTIMVGSFIGSFSLTLSQSTIQRLNSTPHLKDANTVLYIAGPVFITMQIMSMSVGLVCYAFYVSKGCDPATSGQISNPNQIVPYMIVNIFREYTGLSGLFISALFSASLSTMSSLLAGLSAITVEDLVKPFSNLSDKTLTLIAKLVVVLYGAVGAGVAFLIAQVKGSLTQILFSIMGAATGPSVGIFFLAMFFPRSTTKGVFIGGLVGLILSFWICIGAQVVPLPKTPPLPLPPIHNCSIRRSMFSSNMTTASDVSDLNLYSTTTTAMTSTPEWTTANIPKPPSKKAVRSTVTGLESMYTLSYALYSTVGTLVTVLVGGVISMILYDPERDKADPRYVLPLFDQLCCCAPVACLRRLRCGVDYSQEGLSECKDGDGGNEEKLKLNNTLEHVGSDEEKLKQNDVPVHVNGEEEKHKLTDGPVHV